MKILIFILAIPLMVFLVSGNFEILEKIWKIIRNFFFIIWFIGAWVIYCTKLDILIDFEPDKENYDNFMAVYDKVERLFKNEKVEIVTKNGLSPYGLSMSPPPFDDEYSFVNILFI